MLAIFAYQDWQMLAIFANQDWQILVTRFLLAFGELNLEKHANKVNKHTHTKTDIPYSNCAILSQFELI